MYRLSLIFVLNTALSWGETTADGLAHRVSWKQLRDAQVVKQQQDYSCGAASIATILRYYYGVDVDETAVLEKTPDLDSDMSASFLELSQGGQALGFRTQGVEIEFDTLRKLTVPAIAHLRFEGRDHFSVIRGIDPATGLVWLADPSWGNRYFPRHRFLELWAFENGRTGRLLLLAPADSNAAVKPDFFERPHNRLGLARTLAQKSNYR